MQKTYVTFKPGHDHLIEGTILNTETVAVIKTDTQEEGVQLAAEYFGNQFDKIFTQDAWQHELIFNYPLGYTEISNA